jgi:hypothetical protein
MVGVSKRRVRKSWLDCFDFLPYVPVSLIRCHAMSYTFFLINILFACLFTKFLSANHLSYLYSYVSLPKT